MNTQLLIGLGNPGRKYEETRHNIGFIVLDRFAEKFGFEIKKKKFKGRHALVELFGRKICCIKPENYMNLSGEVVDSYWNFYKVEPSDVLVVHDDIDLDLGRLRFKKGSGHGGHNGIRSILDWVYTNDFYRLKIGVGRPPEFMDPADYVLSKFADDEMSTVNDIVEKAVDAIEIFYNEGPKKVMKVFNS